MASAPTRPTQPRSTRLYRAKGRPADHPVIVHLAGMPQLAQWARDITPIARKLARQFWPGPLTMILKRAPGVCDAVTGGQDTVGIRIPAHALALALLEKFGGGVAAPSANRFGRVSATTAAHVREEFGTAIDMILDGGASDVGIESTIVDATGTAPVLLRPGHISARDIEEACRRGACAADRSFAARAGHACRALCAGNAATDRRKRFAARTGGNTHASGQARRGARAQRSAASARRHDMDRRTDGSGGLRA